MHGEQWRGEELDVGGVLHEVGTRELRSGFLQFPPCDLPEAVRGIVWCTRVCTCRHR